MGESEKGLCILGRRPSCAQAEGPPRRPQRDFQGGHRESQGYTEEGGDMVSPGFRKTKWIAGGSEERPRQLLPQSRCEEMRGSVRGHCGDVEVTKSEDGNTITQEGAFGENRSSFVVHLLSVR